jgi:hypothetical protein
VTAKPDEAQEEEYFAARPSEERLLHVLETGDGPNLGQPGYEIRRSDLKEVLDDLQWAREKLLEEQAAHTATHTRLEALERDEEKLREDLEDLQNQREDWESQEAALRAETARRDEMIDSMRRNGAVHWFVYSHQEFDPGLGRWVDRCKMCGKSRDDAVHFGQSGKG